ncbi:MAG TPA: phage BR0599 family protein [Kofleriaceae bacterium]|nr:phage BR0599 family protein [Kofleriaceae bacterium]
MAFDDDERSIAQSRPIDLYTFSTPTIVYRLTSHVSDVTYAGNTYTAITMSRGAQQVAKDATGRELIVYLPITHQLVQRFAASGIPEREVAVTVMRFQEVSGTAIQYGSGFAQSIAIEGGTALIRVPSTTDDALRIRLPVVAAQKLCNNTLYDSICGVDRTRAAFHADAQIVSMTTSTLVVTTIGIDANTGGANADHWAQYGEVLHVASGQRRMVLDQVGTTLTLNAPLIGVQPGDPVTVFAGCDHLVATCRTKFLVIFNFTGLPYLNATINPWAPKGFGVVQQP